METLYQSPLGVISLKTVCGALVSLKFCENNNTNADDYNSAIIVSKADNNSYTNSANKTDNINYADNTNAFETFSKASTSFDGVRCNKLMIRRENDTAGDKVALEKTIKWLDIYFAHKEPNFTPPLNFLDATIYQRLVWSELCAIPYGTTTTYLSIAQKAATKTKKHPSPQATGGALHSNPIALIVPCHRVILSNGELGGYAYGTDKKLALLKMEGAF